MTDGKILVQKRSKFGSSSPIVARLLMQAIEFVPILGEDKAGLVVSAYRELCPKLLVCHQIERRAWQNLEMTVLESIAAQERGFHSMPFQIDLEEEATLFLMQGKQFIRDLVPLINLLFDAALEPKAEEVASVKRGQLSRFQQWAATAHPGRTDFHRWLERHVEWMAELSRRRNAVEHPNDRSGTMRFENFTISEDGELVRPRWWREGSTDEAPEDVAADLEVFVEQLLRFSEELLLWAALLSPRGQMIQFDEIPLEDRNPDAPKRFRCRLIVPYRNLCPE